MARSPKPKIKEEDLHGFKHFKLLLPVLGQLHHDACQRDRGSNRHLLSHCPNGIEIQTYLAIIACLLIALWTGRKPTLRTYEMICHYFTGLATEEELLAHIEKLAPQS